MQPTQYDAVLGGQNPPPLGVAVLGGISGVKSRLASPILEVKIAALSEALKYGDAGLDLIIHKSNDDNYDVRKNAQNILLIKAPKAFLLKLLLVRNLKQIIFPIKIYAADTFERIELNYLSYEAQKNVLEILRPLERYVRDARSEYKYHFQEYRTDPTLINGSSKDSFIWVKGKTMCFYLKEYLNHKWYLTMKNDPKNREHWFRLTTHRPNPPEKRDLNNIC